MINHQLIVCPSCKVAKERDGYYWRKGRPTERINHACKECEIKRQTVRNQNKKMALADPLYAYFH